MHLKQTQLLFKARRLVLATHIKNIPFTSHSNHFIGWFIILLKKQFRCVKPNFALDAETQLYLVQGINTI